ncbi:glycosyl transferase [Pectobacterium brasiliense]|uniref:glycosyltransferase family 2 protein n=1 Tax=Pectobacterium brasiliense TaxID=180957 RepID=UPI0001A43035|nr:glycosyltransferase family 2 protein [Pectobacterium brasiliense]KGA24612.1 glycosyl transferase [Pectobacterium brasiliense]KRF61588.1 glycosyl transferase [Pectobacterium brasiliense]MBN3185751.1 glycosyltransferase family 2 protein [Pectobacterium brasiliense]MBN3263475.1 glycosyltransferase family 2 protein [Pectobacterium brasiliense]QHG26601.1 glycosyltransferase [Pectobacterium brasiliense]
MNTSIALVLVTYNRVALLKEMLCSILEQIEKPAHVYIIDNNSSDNTATEVAIFIEENRDSLQVSYHNTGKNLGGAGGFEFGSRLAYEAGYEWIWLADDDVVFFPDCLSNLLKYRSAADILQPVRMNTDGSCAEISGIDYEINNPFRLNPKKIKITDIYDKNWEIQEIHTIPFEGPLINRRVFERIGFPNKNFFIFYDDLDFAIRANQAGYKIICVKLARMERKIKFVQSRALTSWKGYFMYRNFFKVQLTYARRPLGIIRSLAICITVSVYSIFTGKIKSLPTLFFALRDALKKDFPLDSRFKP